MSSDPSAVEPFCQELLAVIKEEGYTRDQVFNADEETLRGQKLNILPTYQQGLSSFYSQKWDEAIQLFDKCLETLPKDFITEQYILRANEFKVNPPPANWDGSIKMQEK